MSEPNTSDILRTMDEQRRLTLEILMEIRRLPAWRRDVMRRLDEVETRMRKLEQSR
jgi:hypothetical protein